MNKKDDLYTIFDTLRFPLAFMVVLIHCCNISNDTLGVTGPTPISLNEFLQFSLSNIVCSVAVPTFFFISGYLFFLNIGPSFWEAYKVKLKKRIRTLFKPYILWISLSILITVFSICTTSILFDRPIGRLYDYFATNGWIRLYWDSYEWGGYYNILGMKLTNTSPALVPFWFIRDLMVSVILSPVIYFLIKNLKGYLIAALIILYIFNIPTEYHGLGLNMWFSIGAYLAIFHIDFIRYCNKARWISYSMSILLFISCLLVYDNLLVSSLKLIFTFVGVFTMFVIAFDIHNSNIAAAFRKMKSSTFFVYAFHGFIVTHIHTLLVALTAPIGECNHVVAYIVCPFITVGISLVLYRIGVKISPRIMTNLGCER